MTENNIEKYGFKNEVAKPQTTALGNAQESKAVQEIQAALVIAQRFPRDTEVAFKDIMHACKRPILAEQAQYAYPRGGQMITGASIRLAEVLSNCWGNMSSGFREISNKDGVSEVEAFCWDLQKNVQVTRIFHVPHMRHTKKGSYPLTDPRDIYELISNQAQRRVRACILGVIPGDVVDAAIEQCTKTLSSGEEPLADRIRRLVMAFDEIGVSIPMIEKRLGHKMEAIIDTELVSLRAIYKSIKDGVSDRTQWFEFEGESKDKKSEAATSSIDSLIATKDGKNTEKPKEKEDK